MNKTTLFHMYSNLLAVGKIREMVDLGDVSYVQEKYLKYKDYIEDDFIHVSDFLSYAYLELKKHYQNEFVYKNVIVNALIAKHSFNTSVIFNEFHVGKSIADIIFLNGKDCVYEIKSEYDSNLRLNKQILEYQKAFSRIFVVIPEIHQDKYLHELSSNIGIIKMTRRGAIKTLREATEDKSHLDKDVMMKCLRKQEYTNIINEFTSIPKVTPIRYFKECLRLFRQLPINELHPLFIRELKKRKQNDMAYLKTSVPDYLKYLLINLRLNENSYKKLDSCLKQLLVL